MVVTQENANAGVNMAATLAREAVCSASRALNLVNAGLINWLEDGNWIARKISMVMVLGFLGGVMGCYQFNIGVNVSCNDL